MEQEMHAGHTSSSRHSQAAIHAPSDLSSAAAAEAVDHDTYRETAFQQEVAAEVVSRLQVEHPVQEQGSLATVPDASTGAIHSQSYQQQQQDIGDGEHKLAMELLRSVEEDGDRDGQVIVCSAPEADSKLTLFVAQTTGQTVSAAFQNLANQKFSSTAGCCRSTFAVGASVDPSGPGPENLKAGDASTERPGDLGLDDSYIAHLTFRALEQEREEVLKVKDALSSRRS
ncbi:uncharacterized protein LOC113146489 [Cyclospora cayetanensis]|uniref:Uncharacterized protein LOC113146489 n=1 Tax=Cyclospora cayetanensis TaxID=88456 RepID=A0A6P6RQG4_9EIME|nr:uncharacterized protein LOC113146489 [Cyclospora cayetanensis]